MWTVLPVFKSRSSGIPGRRHISPTIHERLGENRRYADHRREVESTVVIPMQYTEFGFTYARCIFQHCLEHRLQLAGR